MQPLFFPGDHVLLLDDPPEPESSSFYTDGGENSSRLLLQTWAWLNRVEGEERKGEVFECSMFLPMENYFRNPREPLVEFRW